MYTLAQVDTILEKSSYIQGVFAQGDIFRDATNQAIFDRVFILHKTISYDRWRVGVTAYNSQVIALNTLLEVFDYLYPIPTAVLDFYPIDGNSSIRYVTGINDSIISALYTWSSTQIDSILRDSTYSKTKIPITVSGVKTITWQTDIAPGSAVTYATKHSNLGFTCTGFYEDVLDASVIERSYNPNIIITRSGANIITVEFTDVFVGYIIIS